jgi:hypothetical protein
MKYCSNCFIGGIENFTIIKIGGDLFSCIRCGYRQRNLINVEKVRNLKIDLILK